MDGHVDLVVFFILLILNLRGHVWLSGLSVTVVLIFKSFVVNLIAGFILNSLIPVKVAFSKFKDFGYHVRFWIYLIIKFVILLSICWEEFSFWNFIFHT